MGLLDKLTAPFKGVSDWQKHRGAAAAQRDAAEQAQMQARRDAYFRQIMEEFADAERIEPKQYRELSMGEAKTGKTPAIEYLQNTGAARLHNLMTQDHMRQAALITAHAMRLDDAPEGDAGEIIDIKPQDMAAIEHGAVNLGPVDAFQDALGTRWRLFIELSYSAATGSARSGIQTRRFIADCTFL